MTSKSMLPCRRELDFQESCAFDAELEKGLQKCPRSTSKLSRGLPRSARGRPQDSPGAGPGAPRGSISSRPACKTSPHGFRRVGRLHFGTVWEPFSEDCRSQSTLVWGMSGISQRLRRGHSGGRRLVEKAETSSFLGMLSRAPGRKGLLGLSGSHANSQRI